MPFLMACGCAYCQANTDPSGSGEQAISTPVAAGGISTGTSYIDALLAGSLYRWNYSSPMGTAVSVNYTFNTATPSYYASSAWERQSFVQLNTTQKQAVRDALAYYAEVANITFNEVADSGATGQMRFGMASLPSYVGAWAYYPNPGDPYGGDVWLNNIPEFNDMSKGGYGFQATMHEIGHALGLKHPGNYNAGGGGTEGPYLPASTDSLRYTVMSYNTDLTQNYRPQTLQMYDIAAIQYLYGANTSTRSGNNNYAWTANQEFVQTIWDGGGTDTLDGSNQTRRSIINLAPGSFSSLGRQGINTDATDNLAIAYNCIIENAKGGSGNDVIWGNTAGNLLEGNGGNDFLYGGTGSDTLAGGAGTDTLDGGAGSDTAYFTGAQGSYTVSQSGAITTVTGAEGTKYLSNVEQLFFAGDGSTMAVAASQPTPKGDVNGDGKADLLWRNTSTGAVELWTVNGATVSSKATLQVNLKEYASVGSNWSSKGIGDFDGDGKEDILWWDQSSGSLALWFMNGRMVMDGGAVTSGGSAVTLSSAWKAEAIADFTGDGKDEILWRNTTTGAISLWEMDGRTIASGGNSGAVLSGGSAMTLSSAWSVSSAADFTGDGKADLLLRNASTGGVLMWQMDGRTVVAGGATGAVQSGGANVTLSSAWRTEGAADFTGDGKADILLRNSGTGSMLLWEMNGRTVNAGGGTGAVTLATLAPANVGTPGTLRTEGVADTTGDGRAEVLWRNPSTGQLSVWQLSGTTVSSDSVLQMGGSSATLDSGWELEAMVDLTGDGRADALWRNTATGAMTAWELNGNTVVGGANTGSLLSGGSNVALSSAWEVAAAADFTGDDKADLLLRNASTGAVLMWEMNGRTVTAGGNTGAVQSGGANVTLSSAWKTEGVADFTGDGKADILLRNSSTGALLMWEMNGRAVTAGANTGAVLSGGANVTLSSAWRTEGVADFTGDGKADILLRNGSTGGVLLWEMNGRTITAGGSSGMVQSDGTNVSVTDASGWAVAKAADLSGDGKADILWRNNSTGKMLLWQMDGRTTITTGTVQQTNASASMGTGSEVVATRDYTGDGKADIMWRDTSTGQVSLWAMNGRNSTSVNGLQYGGSSMVASSAWTDVG